MQKNVLILECNEMMKSICSLIKNEEGGLKIMEIRIFLCYVTQHSEQNIIIIIIIIIILHSVLH